MTVFSVGRIVRTVLGLLYMRTSVPHQAMGLTVGDTRITDGSPPVRAIRIFANVDEILIRFGYEGY